MILQYALTLRGVSWRAGLHNSERIKTSFLAVKRIFVEERYANEINGKMNGLEKL